jgi:hypothetical protein
LIYQGDLLVTDTPSSIRSQVSGSILEVRTENNQKCVESLEGLTSLKDFVLSGDKVHVYVEDPREGERVIREVLGSERIGLLELQTVRPTLEDAFVSIVQKKRAIETNAQ